MTSETQSELAARHRPDLVVNGQTLRPPNRTQTARSVLTLAGLLPASEHVLIHLKRPGTIAVGLDETIDLSGPGPHEFRAFRSDRIFNFTVDEVGYAWGASEIAEVELRDIACVPADRVLVIERDRQPDEVVPEGGVVSFKGRGVEDLRTRKRFVTVTYGDDEVRFLLEPRIYTGAELATVFNVPEGYVIDLVEGGVLRILKPDDKLRVKDGMHFISQPGKGASS